MPATGVLARLRSDCLYLLVSFPLGIVTFLVMVTGVALGVGLAITLVGLPVLAATLRLAALAAGIERIRIAGCSVPFSPARSTAPWRSEVVGSHSCGTS